MSSILKLHSDAQFTSPYVMSVFVCLKEKSIPFELISVDLNSGEQTSPEYKKKSITQRVPCLIDEDFALSESSAITEYLEEKYPQTPLYPANPIERARARQIQAWIRSSLMPIRQERDTRAIFYGMKFPPLSEEGQAAATQLFEAADALIPDGKSQLFSTWSLADLDLAIMIQRLNLHGDAVPEKLANFVKQQWDRPSVQAWLALPRP